MKDPRRGKKDEEEVVERTKKGLCPGSRMAKRPSRLFRWPVERWLKIGGLLQVLFGVLAGFLVGATKIIVSLFRILPGVFASATAEASAMLGAVIAALMSGLLSMALGEIICLLKMRLRGAAYHDTAQQLAHGSLLALALAAFTPALFGYLALQNILSGGINPWRGFGVPSALAVTMQFAQLAETTVDAALFGLSLLGLAQIIRLLTGGPSVSLRARKTSHTIAAPPR